MLLNDYSTSQVEPIKQFCHDVINVQLMNYGSTSILPFEKMMISFCVNDDIIVVYVNTLFRERERKIENERQEDGKGL